MAILPLSHSKQNQSPPISPRLSVVREKSSANDMPGRNLLDAAPAAGAGANMNKGKIVKIAAVSVLTILLLAAAAVSIARYDADQLRAFLGSDFMLTVCVVTHVTTICLLAWFAATAPTPASRRSHAKAIVTSCGQFALNLYLVLMVGRAEVQDTA